MAYIEKDEALAIIENRQRELCPMGRYSRNAVYGSDREAFDNWQEILDEIEAIPSADVASVRHGRWVKQDDYSCCSGCGQSIADECVPWFKFCPNCGAIMDLEG